MEDHERIIAVFDELVKRYRAEHGTSLFTPAERAVWFLVSVRCEMDINGFDSVFQQLLKRSEAPETIAYLEAVGLPEIAAHFRNVLALRDAHDFYAADGQAQISFYATGGAG